MGATPEWVEQLKKQGLRAYLIIDKTNCLPDHGSPDFIGQLRSWDTLIRNRIKDCPCAFME